MKTITVNLQDSIVTTYSATKTTALGRAYAKTINSVACVAPPLIKSIDVYTDTAAGGAAIPLYMHTTPNNRMFVFTAITSSATSIGTILYYTFDLATGAYAYQGRLQYQLPNTAATTHTIRAAVVDDTTSTFKIWVATTGAVAINGGLFLINGVTAADFVPVGFATLPLAISSNQKAVYQVEDPATPGVANPLVNAIGLSVPYDSTNGAINTKVYVHNCAPAQVAVHQFHVFDGVSTPTIVTKTCTSSTTSGSATFTMSSHGFATNDPVIITASAPTAFTTSTSAAQTVYFCRNVATNTFELSANSGGGSISCTSSTTPTVARAFGQALNLFSLKTGNLPALTGTTTLANDAEGHCKPMHTVCSGFDCTFMSTGGAGNTLYVGKLSELTTGATTWPSITAANPLGSGIDVVTPAVAFASFGSVTDVVAYNTQTSCFIIKKMTNSSIVNSVGYLSNQYLETTNPITIPFGLAAIAGMDMRGGWLFASGSTVGQRVIIGIDLHSDKYFNFSRVISPVMYIGHATLKSITTYEELYEYTGTMAFYIRSAATAGDAVFSSADGGWTLVTTVTDLTSVAVKKYIQIQVLFNVVELSPCQLHDIIITTLPRNALSDYWEGSVDNTSASGTSPAYSAFRLKQAYGTSVPKLFFRAYADDGSLVVEANTEDATANFSYSTNNGTSWNALGTIANTPNTTELRYLWTTPPGVRVTVSLNEE